MRQKFGEFYNRAIVNGRVESHKVTIPFSVDIEKALERFENATLLKISKSMLLAFLLDEFLKSDPIGCDHKLSAFDLASIKLHEETPFDLSKMEFLEFTNRRNYQRKNQYQITKRENAIALHKYINEKRLLEERKEEEDMNNISDGYNPEEFITSEEEEAELQRKLALWAEQRRQKEKENE